MRLTFLSATFEGVPEIRDRLGEEADQGFPFLFHPVDQGLDFGILLGNILMNGVVGKTRQVLNL